MTGIIKEVHYNDMDMRVQTGAGDWHDFKEKKNGGCGREDLMKPLLYAFFVDPDGDLVEAFHTTPMSNCRWKDWGEYIKWLPQKQETMGFYNYLELFLWIINQRRVLE